MRWRWLLPLGVLVLLVGYALGPGSPGARAGVAVFTSPAVPRPGGSLRAMAVSESARDATLAIIGPDGEEVGHSRERHDGPPYWWYVQVQPGAHGLYRVCLRESGTCTEVAVDDRSAGRAAGEIWPITREWNRATEDLYAAWIERLLGDPADDQSSWPALHEITRQRERNFLHDHLGLGEDDADGLRLEPDCADLPYFLRAYFAWKLGLPFGYSECSRGSSDEPPTCTEWHAASPPESATELTAMQQFFQRLADVVHSGNGRAPADSDQTDFYPIRLSGDALRAGTVYADPYGHTLLVVHRNPQTPSAAGVLLAADAQPDGTVARKRYWRGNFLFALDPALGSPGFKHFRPIVRDGATLRPLTNREIAQSADYGDYGVEQYDAGVEGFYDRVDAILSPQPLEPERALAETIDALEEQVRARVQSVANGEAYAASHHDVIPMPEGAAIFETIGAWEDFATPSRDLRLLIALDVVRAFPAKVETHPERFVIAAGRSPAEARSDLEALLGAQLAARHVVYTRSDGSEWALTLADVLSRAPALEAAYDPNDCAEVRWGAPSDSAESSTCQRRAPDEQTARMASYRPWFHERTRPPR